MRFERKYRITHLSHEELVSILEIQACGFQNHYPDRQVNSIYFDDATFSNLHANLSGVSKRSKFRIRWYGEDLENIKNPILEKKIKENQLGDKEYLKLADFNASSQLFEISQADALVHLDLHPVVSVHYQRSYFVSFHKQTRATIDSDVQFRQVENHHLSKQSILDPALILEIKYDQADEEVANEIIKQLPFRITKNSKYVSAVETNWF